MTYPQQSFPVLEVKVNFRKKDTNLPYVGMVGDHVILKISFFNFELANRAFDVH